MKKKIDADTAQQILLEHISPLETEEIRLEEASGRVLAREYVAATPFPPFSRSVYDGYACRAQDLDSASKEAPVVLTITEEVPAGHQATVALSQGFATKINTGAPIPPGADAVIKYEDTEFTDKEVKFFSPIAPRSNIAFAGEEIREGALIASAGKVITPPLIGLLGIIGEARVLVYKKPKVAVLSFGSELVGVGEAPGNSQIRNSNSFAIGTFLGDMGIDPIYGGIARDRVGDIAQTMKNALEASDLVISTGGASVGDYDLVLPALEMLGAEILIKRVGMKPGGNIIVGYLEEKCIICLSGNPSAAMVGLIRVALPAIRKLCGRSQWLLNPIEAVLKTPFTKASGPTRLLWGSLIIEGGTAFFQLQEKQGNGMASSFLDCDLLGEIPAGSPPLGAGSRIKAFIL